MIPNDIFRLDPTEDDNLLMKKFQHFLYTKNLPDVDLVIRTSGEKRLSDFMLWQGSHAHLEFLKIYWPQMSIWELTRALLRHQTWSLKQSDT
jgi:undecaprenyl diphosphate synthase